MFADLYIHTEDVVGGGEPIIEPPIVRPIPCFIFDPGVHESLTRRGTNLHAPDRAVRSNSIAVAAPMNTIFAAILAEMHTAESLPKSSGGTKKGYVLAALEMSGMITPDNRQEVSMLIELVVYLSRRPEVLKIFTAAQVGCTGFCRQS